MVDPESGKTQMTLTQTPAAPHALDSPRFGSAQAWQLLSTLSSSQSITLSVNKLVTEH